MQSYGTKNMLEHGIHIAFYKETNLLCVHIYWLWMGQGAQGWCTGITQRDGMGREEGGGFGMGNTCTLMVDSYQCATKPLQYYKVISLQLK